MMDEFCEIVSETTIYISFYDELDITSATVSFNMSKLYALNLVKYERCERKRIYYCADKDVVSKVLKTVEKNILGQ